VIQPNSEAIRIPAPGVCRGSITSRSASQNGPSPAAWMAGTEGPAAASARTASLASGHSFVTVTLPRSRGMKPAETSISSITPGRPVSPWRMLASPWLRGDSSMILRKYGMRPTWSRRPQKARPSRPPGTSTRAASRNAASQPFQIPLKLVATSKQAPGNGRANTSPSRKSPSAVRALAIRTSASEASIPATAAPRRAAS